MNINVTASTKVDYIAPKQELDFLSGRTAGTCYMPQTFKELKEEEREKTLKRSERTKQSGHHSVTGHGYITLELENIPKLFAMLLNNEKVYNTSEKSARYTQMELSGLEKELYDKWYKIFLVLIEDKYGNVEYFTPLRIKKLAMENARYFTSVMTPTSMNYTTSYQQLNYMCGWMQKFNEQQNPIYKMLKPSADEFLNKINDLGYLDENLINDGKNREFSLVAKRARQEQFGECYSVNYKASFACLAHTQRHRTLHYELSLMDQKEYYVPQLLKKMPNLVEEWILDMQRVADITPQGELIAINERGDYENLILKAKERICTAVQLETQQNVKEVIDKVIANTDNEYVKADLEKVAKGARCVNGYKCKTPCKFVQGIYTFREI